MRQLQQGLEDVVSDPRRGDACDDIRAGYRESLVDSHVVFYRLTAAGIDVVRILHASRDFKRHL